MILSARIVKHPREPRHCDDCDCQINGPQLRLYGMAEYGDKPRLLYFHPFACNGRLSPLDNPEIMKKLDEKNPTQEEVQNAE